MDHHTERSRPTPIPSKIVTLKDVADRCGVNIMTVSRALRFEKNPHVSQATAERVRAAAAELGYDPSRTLSARRLVAQRHSTSYINHAIAVFFSPYFYQEPYYCRIYQGILDVMLPEEYALVMVHVYNPNVKPGELTRIPNIVARGEVDGMLAFPSEELLRLIETQVHPHAGASRLPLVGMLQECPGYSAVTVDEFRGGELAVGHLLDLGHRAILAFSTLPQRMAGYRQAYARRGIPADTLYTAQWTPDPDRVGRYVAPMWRMLAAHTDVTAIVAPNDLVAQDIAGALMARGDRIPEDISLVSNDDTRPVLPHHQEPTLTTVRLPLEEVGRLAAERLLREINHPDTAVQQVCLPVELIVRSSTARRV
ncbi:MAG TPA: LacI family DNA-binding transcriptional regulator [Armatimonadota bacterium]|nr:LacI family DNA-binding transcriptional regulator [Armatimonadota bacterium]